MTPRTGVNREDEFGEESSFRIEKTQANAALPQQLKAATGIQLNCGDIARVHGDVEVSAGSIGDDVQSGL